MLRLRPGDRAPAAAMLHAALLLMHLLAATVWVGGMAVMQFAVRPAAVATLEPPQRLPFLAMAMARFFTWVLAAILVLFASGTGLVMMAGGFAAVHWSVQAMMALALAMAALFAWIRLGPFPALRRALDGGDLKAAGARLALVRSLITTNLVLGTLVYALALLGRAL